MIEFFGDIRNNQGRGKCNQLRPDTCRDLDYSGYHKNRIQLLFYYTLSYGKYTKTIVCVMQADFICACKNTRTNTPSGRTLKTIQVLTLFSQRCALRTV